MTALLFFASLAVALVVTDLGSVFQVVGGTAGSIMIFILPGLVAIQLRQDAHADSQPLAFGESQEVQGREEDMMERKPFKFKGSMTPGFLVLLFGVVLLVDTVLESAGLITS